MRIIAQKSNNLNTSDFFYHSLTKDYISAISFNVTYTKDGKLVVFNTSSLSAAVINTINNSTFGQLQGYEVTLLNDILNSLNTRNIKKEIYIDLVPSNTGLVTNENIEQVTSDMNHYIEAVYQMIKLYPELSIKLHSVSRNLIMLMKNIIKDYPIGFAITGEDNTFIDVDYYVITVNVLEDNIIDLLLKKKKEVIVYVYSDYYISYLYEHYLGEKSTPYLQNLFLQLAIMTSYPDIINKIFSS